MERAAGTVRQVAGEHVDPVELQPQRDRHLAAGAERAGEGDVGTQYRSAIYTFSDAQAAAAQASKEAYNKALADSGYGPITTEIAPAGPFYYAEDYHQQYLAKNPFGYCGLGGTGVACS